MDFIILDVNMPVLGGIECLKVIKSKSELSSKPVLVLSTESSDDKITEAEKLGVSGWLIKPFEKEQLLSTISKLTS